MGNDLDWQAHRDYLIKLAELDYNYDEKMYHNSKNKKGWYVDHYRAVLGKEPAGPPLPDGSFEKVKQAIQLYKFPNPRLIRAVFDPQQALSGRNMLMFAHFAGFEFTFGVRVTSVVDEMRKSTNNEDMQVWGYSYRTLKGHFEVGEIKFIVDKNLATGEISFEIDAYSRPDRIPNLFYRVGFRIFGRPLQKYFAKTSIQRLRKISESVLTKI